MAIFIDDELNILINGKEVYFTLHVREEIDEYEKDTMFVCEIVDKGEKKMVSKNENRYESEMYVGGTEWIAVWFDMDDKILIKHLGKR
ncbi:MAG: hypothetical protein HYT73_04590 [Candidatus Aenigmarchaeota archaeon]|nr:hypothetical protein [Candidatus Aenigmarchaeota archaeon]